MLSSLSAAVSAIPFAEIAPVVGRIIVAIIEVFL